jgi:hypothetical protein
MATFGDESVQPVPMIINKDTIVQADWLLNFYIWVQLFMSNTTIHQTTQSHSIVYSWVLLVIQCRYLFRSIEPSSGDILVLTNLILLNYDPIWIHIFYLSLFVTNKMKNTMYFSHFL